MPRHARALQERGVDVKCYIPFKLKLWGESQGLNFSHVLAGALNRMIQGDQSGQTVMDLQEIEYHKSRIADLEAGIKGRTGQSAQEIAVSIPKTIQDEETLRYQRLYAGMDSVGRGIIRGIAKGFKERKPNLASWLETRAKDFEIFEPTDKIIEKLIQFRFWQTAEVQK